MNALRKGLFMDANSSSNGSQVTKGSKVSIILEQYCNSIQASEIFEGRMASSHDDREPMLRVSNSIRVDPTRIRRRKKKQQLEGSANGNTLSRFSRWDQYKQSSTGGGDVKMRSNLGHGLGRRVSVRKTDFTNRKELESFSKQRRFIFHRGFFRRNASRGSIKYRDNRLRLKNSAELNAALQYVDLPTLDMEEVIPTGEVIMFKPEHLRQKSAAVVISSIPPLRTYAKGIHRKASVKRHLPSNTPQEVKLARTAAPASPRRSLTTPASIRSFRQRSYSPHRLRIQELWKEYLLLVISQRLQLRVSLLRDVDDNIGGTRAPPLVLRMSETKESLHSTNDPFAAAAVAAAANRDDVDDPSISLLLAAKRKAF